MKRKDFLTEARGMKTDALQTKARTIAEELMKLRFRMATGQLEQSHRLKVLRKELSRVNTIISEQRLSAGK